jgi:hypothetical protein
VSCAQLAKKAVRDTRDDAQAFGLCWVRGTS